MIYLRLSGREKELTHKGNSGPSSIGIEKYTWNCIWGLVDQKQTN